MNKEKWHEVKRIFNEVVELPLEKQAEFLSLNCKDQEIRAEVEKLVASDYEAETILGLTLFEKSAAPQIERIGNYKIIREIGEGGMGTVFLASREDFDKQVALKIIKYEVFSKNLLRRFQNERKILAALEHQNIARLFDGGTTEKGSPYFVMEYIEGEDLLTYCNSKNISVDERLKIFCKICSAISYAHGKLIVHRDLKPSNIIVAKDGEPKLLDFGISKLLDEESFEQTGTATALGMMTPNYASPEQFRGETVSTSTDVYSLGVILYELLTGVLPYQLENIRIDEIARVVCQTNPQKPSEAVNEKSSVFRKNTNRNQFSQTNDSKFKIQNSKFLRGDLDNIILKSLRKETDRRYSSVEKFSDDIRRHLEGLPVTARPDTFSYRAEKFIKRNRFAVLAGLLISFTLLMGIGGISWQYVRAEREKNLAEKRFGQVREIAKSIVYKYHDDLKGLPGTTKIRENLVKDSLSYLDSLSNDSENDILLQSELAQAYYRVGNIQFAIYGDSLGDIKGAKQSFNKAQQIQESIFNKSQQDLQIYSDLAATYTNLGDIAFSENNESLNRELYEKAQILYEKLLQKSPTDNLNKLKLSNLFIRQASNLLMDDSVEIEHYRNSVALVTEILSQEPDNQDAKSVLGTAYERLGSTLGHPEMSDSGNFIEAEKNLQESLKLRREMYESDKENTLKANRYVVSLHLLGDVLLAENKITDAFEKYQQALIISEKVYRQDGNNDFARSVYVYNLGRTGNALSVQGKFKEAAILLEKSEKICNEFYPHNSDNLLALNSCAKNWIIQTDNKTREGKIDESVNNYGQIIKLYESMMSRGGDDTAEYKSQIALVNMKIGELFLKKNENPLAVKSFQKTIELLDEVQKKETLKFTFQQIYQKTKTLLTEQQQISKI